MVKKKKIKNKSNKHNYKFILGIIIGGIVFGLLGAYAASTIASSSVKYTDSQTVEQALNDLFNKTKIIKQGDYIKLTPSASTYTIAASETGYSAAQTIKPNELTLWRVISVTTDGIEIVSDKVSSTNVAFGTSQSVTTKAPTASNSNVIAYAKFVKTLNTIAAQYTDGTHVKSARHMGYNANFATEEITTTTSLISTSAPWSVSTGKTGATQENLGGGDLGYNVDYDLVKNIYGTGVANKVGTTTATTYWLASRDFSYSSSSRWFFQVWYVYNGNAYSTVLYNRSGSWYFSSVTYAIRPILTLKPDVTVASGTGSETNPYVLN